MKNEENEMSTETIIQSIQQKKIRTCFKQKYIKLIHSFNNFKKLLTSIHYKRLSKILSIRLNQIVYQPSSFYSKKHSFLEQRFNVSLECVELNNSPFYIGQYSVRRLERRLHRKRK